MVIFCNTGREMPATLDFVRDCARHWNVPIVWLEYRHDGKPDYVEVNHATASRNGEPFEAMIRRKRYLPNPVMRFCTTELKVSTMKRFVRRALGWTHWTNVVGLRADEPGRAEKATDPARNPATTPKGKAKLVHWTNLCPLHAAGITVEDVAEFWKAQPFDLGLSGPHQGNCDGCFLKSRGAIQQCQRDDPERMRWWQRMETLIPSKKEGVPHAAFRNDRESYAEMEKAAQVRHSIFDDQTGCDNWACTD